MSNRQYLRATCLLVLLLFCVRGDAETFVYVSLASENKLARYQLDPASGALTFKESIDVEADPGVLTVHPSKKFFYAAMRNAGRLVSYRLDAASGKLTSINSVKADDDPCYIAFDRTGKLMLTSYYVAGKAAVHELNSDGAIKHVGKWYPTADKAHAIVTDRENRWVFVPHTGPNRIYQFKLDTAAKQLIPNDPPFVQTKPNTGPRHFAIHPTLNVGYCDNEQGSSVTAFKLNPKNGTLAPMQTLSTLPEHANLQNSCARMEIHRNGKFLYASNRGHHSIAAFSIDATSGRLTSLGQFATEKTPRGFTIDPSGKFLIVAGEDANRLAVYRIQEDGRLARMGSYPTGKQPWWVTAYSN